MISVNKKILLFIFILIPNGLAQNSLQEQFEFASNLFNEAKYFDAVTEFKRLQFFDKENNFAFQSYLFIGKAYKAGGKFDDAVRYFTLAEMNAQNDQEYYVAKIFNAKTNILRRTNKQAERILDELKRDFRFNSSIKEINYWRGWNYIFSDDWQKAYEIFSKENLDTTLTNICKSVDEEKYSLNFAKYSSYVIPGFGQFYTGEYISGALSLGWNILFGYLTINSLVEDRVFDGIMIGNFLWLRFYTGNTQNAEKFAIQKNLRISNNALDYLQYSFPGKKP